MTRLLTRALRLLAREERLRPDAGWHPSPEELTAYRDGRLPRCREARVCRHLGVCLDCPDLLLDLERFLEPLPDEPGIDTTAWQELRKRLSAAPRPRLPDWRLTPVWTSLRTAYGLAAASLVAAVAVSIWSLSPHAVPNIPMELVDMPGVRRGPEPLREIRVAPAGVVLTLSSALFLQETDLRLEILDLSGRRLGAVEGLRAELGSVRALLPRSLLPQGEIRLRLAGRASSTPAEEVTLRVLHL
jgi:hypothetical protein